MKLPVFWSKNDANRFTELGEPHDTVPGTLFLQKLVRKNPELLTQNSKIQCTLTFLFRDRIQ